jgi:hypothetical protein
VDANRFDRIARSLVASPSRRRFLAGLVAAPSLLAPWDSSPMEARKKKKRKQKLKRNEYGCVDVGQPCRGNSANCCSGHCEGPEPKKGKKDISICVSHHVEECKAGDDVCLRIRTVCGLNGLCFRTTGNASFCGAKGACEACNTDADCEGSFGAGAACAVCAVDCEKTAGTRCVPPASPALS